MRRSVARMELAANGRVANARGKSSVQRYSALGNTALGPEMPRITPVRGASDFFAAAAPLSLYNQQPSSPPHTSIALTDDVCVARIAHRSGRVAVRGARASAFGETSLSTCQVFGSFRHLGPAL